VRVQTQEQAGWFAYRTDVSLGSPRPARTRLVWAVLAAFACVGTVAVFGAVLWLVSLDAESPLHSLGTLSRVLGLLPN
jgi:hypothetical protein